MISALAKMVGKLALLAVSLSVITAISLLLFGSFILSWPVLRLSPTNRKIRTMTDLAAAALAALAAIQPSSED